VKVGKDCGRLNSFGEGRHLLGELRQYTVTYYKNCAAAHFDSGPYCFALAQDDDCGFLDDKCRLQEPTTVDQIMHSVFHRTGELEGKLNFFIAAICSEVNVERSWGKQKYIRNHPWSNYRTDSIHARLVLRKQDKPGMKFPRLPILLDSRISRLPAFIFHRIDEGRAREITVS
jgi:hypothetical protein